MIYVTHDQIEAKTLADRIAIMRDGAVLQFADPHTIYNKPANKYVVGFIGSPSINFLDGHIQEDGKMFVAEVTDINLDRCEFVDAVQSDQLSFGIRPEHVSLRKAADSGFFETELEIDVVEPMGSDTLVWSRFGSLDFRFRVDGHISLKTGDRQFIHFNPHSASIFDRQSEL